jgi:hypothetical protein
MAHVNWNRQLGLAAALFVLGTAAYWFEYKHKPGKEASEEQSKKIFPIKDKQVQSITLFDGNKSVTLNCSDMTAKLCKAGDNSKWEISEPSQLKADDSNVNALLTTLNTLSTAETIDLKDETPEKKEALMKEYGLDAQSRKTDKRVEITTPSEKTVLYLGNSHPIGESIFGVDSKNESRVLLVPSFFKANLEHDLTYWRNKKLLTIAAHEIESFKLDGSKGHLSAERKDGRWVIHSGQEEMDGDTENIDSLLSGATVLTAKEFASDHKTDNKAQSILKGLSPILTLSLQKEKGTAKEAPAPIVLTLIQKKTTAPNNKLYATVSNLDPLFALDPNTKDRLDKSVNDLRLAKLITSMERFSAKKLEFSGKPLGAQPIQLAQENGKWMNQATKTEVPSDAMNNLLDQLSGNRIKGFLLGATIPAGEKEGLKVTLSDEKNEAKRQFVFWKKEEKLYAKDLQSKKNEAYLIDSSLSRALPWSLDFFKKTDSKEEQKSVNAKK